MKRALAAFSIMGAIVCASLGCGRFRPMTAPSNDYVAYRDYRLAEGVGERMGAAWRYLRDHPKGVWAREIGEWFWPIEQKFWSQAGHTPGGAAAYLEFMPDGPHAESEKSFLEAYEREKREGPERERKALEAAKKKADDARKAMGEAIETWTKRALGITKWGETLSTLETIDKDFANPYRLQPPYATCTNDACVKRVSFIYGIPEAIPEQDRTVNFDIKLELDEGRVFSVTLVAPKSGFTWWLEGAESRAIDPTDPTIRTEAIMRAKNRIEKVVRDTLVGKTCTTGETETSRTLDCGNLRIVIEPMANGDDVVRIVGSKT